MQYQGWFPELCLRRLQRGAGLGFRGQAHSYDDALCRDYRGEGEAPGQPNTPVVAGPKTL